MKNIYLIGGTMGVGKTTVCKLLKKKRDKSVFLDGDWCWDAEPFQVTAETKEMVLDNICYLLNNFIRCQAYENIVFCWVLHEQSIIDDILSRLNIFECNVKIISLICNANALEKRLQKDVEAGYRQREIIERSLSRIPLYNHLNTVKIDVSDISAEEAAEKVAAM
jgi:Predicted nucleotide kinase (related to CMP and AMP kinases)